jgi:hypothetical protein
MNRLEKTGKGGAAKVRYLDGDFQVVVPGAHVTCAVTGVPIPLPELRYWSVDRQEAYVNAKASLERELELSGKAED